MPPAHTVPTPPPAKQVAQVAHANGRTDPVDLQSHVPYATCGCNRPRESALQTGSSLPTAQSASGLPLVSGISDLGSGTWNPASGNAHAPPNLACPLTGVVPAVTPR
jgi:hypothetical protein